MSSAIHVVPRQNIRFYPYPISLGGLGAKKVDEEIQGDRFRVTICSRESEEFLPIPCDQLY